ncbi:MAG: hypothetical protein ACOY3J_10240 [Bacillota bacterium]|jgi:F0F1-type ATP synthase membrane subunit b/b'|nr:hypothetical protein [Thermanaerosceptrum fracticalcis]MBZ4653678.1 hypothetical protein [Peptococcaceae bacterium]
MWFFILLVFFFQILFLVLLLDKLDKRNQVVKEEISCDHHH